MNKLFATLILAVVGLMPFQAFSATESAVNDAEFRFNRIAPPQLKLGRAIMKHRVFAVKCKYDFSLVGGAVGAVSLLDEDGKQCKLPKNAIVRDAIIDVVTALTSGGSATVAIGTGQAANDLKAALAYGSYTGIVAGVPVGTAATAIKMTADRAMTATIATAALTAGKMNVLVEYEMSQ